MPSLTPAQKVLAWDAALKVTSTGQTVDQDAMMRIAKSVMTKTSAMSAANAGMTAATITERRAMLAAHFGLGTV